MDQAETILEPIANLTATLFIVFLIFCFGWLEASRVASCGSWKGCTVPLILLIYYVHELIYSLFGEFNFRVPTAAVNRLTVPCVFIGGMFEEIHFRGVILYTLVCVWGKDKRGILKTEAVSSFLYGMLHVIIFFEGDPIDVLGQIAITLFEGIWFAAIVLGWGSV